ncbi:barstar family protein [Streptomyces antibioticus]
MITIDASDVTDERALYLLLMRELGFPGFYGMNWGAFWDSITGLVWIPDHVRFLGWDQLAAHFPRGSTILQWALDNYRAIYRADFVAEFA